MSNQDKNTLIINIKELKTIMDKMRYREEDLIFKKEEIREIPDPLTIFFRTILYEKKITIKKFKGLAYSYYMNIGSKAKSNANSMINRIKREQITWKTFLHVIVNILNYQIKEMGISLFDLNTSEENNYKVVIIDNDRQT